MGTNIGEAYKSGATDGEAFVYGLGAGAIEAGTELLFGGLGKGVKALGISRGIGGLDDIFAKKLSSKIAGSFANESVQRALGNTIEFGVKSAGEGFEEVLSGVGSAVMKKLTYMTDEELTKLLKDENLLNQFIVGTVTSSIVQSADYLKANKTGTDFVTGQTSEQERIIDAVAEYEVAKREENGEKLTNREKNKIYDDVTSAVSRASVDPLEQAAREVVEKRNNAEAKSSNEVTAQTLERLTQASVQITNEQVKKVTGFGDRGAELVANNANADGATFYEVMAEVKPSYTAGFNNPDLDIKKVAHTFNSQAQEDAYTAGQMDGKMLALEQEERAKNAVVNKESGFNAENLPSDVTQRQVEVIDLMAKATGVKAYVAKGLKGNAEYNKATGEVPIDFDFEREIGTDGNKQKVSIVFHAAHEMAVHRVVDLAPEEGKAFVYAMYKHLAGNEPSVFTLADEKRYDYAQQGVEISLAEAMEEISANNILYLYNNNEVKFHKAIENIVKGKDTKAKQGLRKYIDYLNKIIRKIREFLSGKSAQERAEIQAELDEVTRLRDMFETAFAKAVENRKAIQAKTETKSAESLENNLNGEYNGDISHSLKDTPADNSIFDNVLDKSDYIGYVPITKVKMKTFPPYNESKSDANEWSTRWAHREDVEVGAQTLVFYHNRCYVIGKYETADLKYQIDGRISYSAYESIRKELEEDARNREKQSQKKMVDFLRERNERGDTDEGRGQSVDYSSVEHGREDRDILRLGRKQDGKRYLSSDTSRSDEYDSKDRQTKSVNESKSFSLKKPVEETKDLIAVHNLSPEKLLKTLKLGGLPMPSIAIVRSSDGFNKFGEISIVFDKSTIAPELLEENKIYGDDSWTPTYPRVEYEVDMEKASAIYSRARKAGHLTFFNPVYLHQDNIESDINSHKGESGLVESYKNDYGMKQFYLFETGKPVDMVIGKKSETMSEQEIEQAEFITKELGKENILKIKSDNYTAQQWMQEFGQQYKDALFKYYRGKVKETATDEQIWDLIDFKKAFQHSIDVQGIKSYIENGATRTEAFEDLQATRKKIDSAVNQEDYEKWLTELFKGVVIKSGIRNNVDSYTEIGDRKSFDETHYAETLENVVRAMKEEEKQTGNAIMFSGLGLWGTAAKRYSSIDDVKNDSNRLVVWSDEKFSEVKRAIGGKLSDLADRIKSTSEPNELIARDTAIDLILETISDAKNRSGMLKQLKSYYGLNQSAVDENVVQEIIDLVAEVQAMPTDYFEAKPQRAVGIDEIKAVIMPEQSSFEDDVSEIKSFFEKQNIPVIEYEYGDNNARLKALNSLEDVKFSLKGTSSTTSDGAKKLGVSERLAKYAKDGLIPTEVYNELIEKYGAIPTGENPHRIEDILQSFGYDGFAYQNKNEGDGWSYAVFDDTQIVRKSTNSAETDTFQNGDTDELAMWTTKRVGGEVKPKSISEIVATIQHEYGINITTGHIRGKGVLGQYTKNNRGIRTKIANNLPIIAHELGHYFERTLDIKSQLTEELEAEKAHNEMLYFMEEENDEHTGSKEDFESWLKSYNINKGATGDNIFVDGNRGASIGNGSIHSEQQASNRKRADGRSSANSEPKVKSSVGSDIQFSLKKPVEETKDLIAVHNISPAKLLKTLKLGGFPMPSIAVARASDGFNQFGEISIAFDRNTIDPQVLADNKIYGSDAWTPVYRRC